LQHLKLPFKSKIKFAAFAHMQDVFQATITQDCPTSLKPVSSLNLWLDPGAAAYSVALFWDWVDLQPKRQQLIDKYGPNAIVKMKTPAPEHYILDALHIRPLEGSRGHDRAVILCAGANGHYEDDFTSKFVQVWHPPFHSTPATS
jgi:hypothetical protein